MEEHGKPQERQRKVSESYEVYAGGGLIRHEFDDEGFHRIVGWDGATSDWMAYTSLAVISAPYDSRYVYIGATAYGLLQNAKECVARVEVLVSASEPKSA